MSLEIAVQNLTSEIITLTTEIITLRQLLQSQSGNAVQAQPAPVAAAPVFTPPAAAPAVQFVPPVATAHAFVPPATAVVAAPPVVPAPAPGACPIVDQKTLVEYVMDAYKTLGPQKGAQIQGVLNNCQVQSINECRPEHYAYIHQCVEQLKAS